MDNSRGPARSLYFAVICLGAALSGPFSTLDGQEAWTRQLLNSERIEQTFGSYGIEILETDTRVRVSNLYSTHGATQVCRTFAVVSYPDPIPAEVAAEHGQILTGGSIGAVFAARGWAVDKVNRYLGTTPSTGRSRQLMGGISAQALAVHVYDLAVTKSGLTVTYATIAEVHHPEYLQLEDIRAIYGEMARSSEAADISPMLELVREKMN